MSLKQKINLVGFLDSMRIIVAWLNHFTELCKTIVPDLIQVKPLNKSAAGLNHYVDLS